MPKPQQRQIIVSKTSVMFICFIVVLLTLSFFNLSLFLNHKGKIVPIFEKIDYSQKILFWQSFLESHPDYFDGWMEIARLQLKSGNIEEAEAALFKAQLIKPNSPDINLLENELVSSVR